MPSSTEESIAEARPQGTCLSFDYGTKNIGLAVGETQLQSARPLDVISNRHGTPDWESIREHINQWQPTNIIVGWPLTEAGEEQPLCQHVTGFIKRLEKTFQLPVHRVDERFSSNAAQEQIRHMRQSGQRKRRSKHTDIDSMAAALILETWFSQHCE